MLCPADLTETMERTLPALHQPLHTQECERSVYKKIGVLSRYAAEKARGNDLGALKRAFQLANDLYEDGNAAVRSAIATVFVFSLSSTLGCLGAARKTAAGLLPMTLFSLYLKQVLHKGC